MVQRFKANKLSASSRDQSAKAVIIQQANSHLLTLESFAMKKTAHALLLATSILAFASHAQTPLNDIESKLVGVWAEGLSKKSSTASPAALAKLAESGLIANVVEYKPDHSFVMYPKCADLADFRQNGIETLKGTWTLSQAGELAITVTKDGKSHTFSTNLTWEDGALVLTDKDGKPGGTSRRYNGSLPPHCKNPPRK